MTRLQIGVVRYASVGAAIARALGVQPPPDCRVGHGRITLTFRKLGASRWPEAQQIAHALRVAEAARAVFADDSRGAVRRQSRKAIVVTYEDASLVRGCVVESR